MGRSVVGLPIGQHPPAHHLRHPGLRARFSLWLLQQQGQELLGEKGLAAAPLHHGRQCRLRLRHPALQPRQEGPGLRHGEAAQLHRVIDIECAAALPADQVVRSGHPQKGKAEAPVHRLIRPPLVQGTNQRKETIGAELQAEQAVYLLHKDHQRRVAGGRQQVAVDELEKPLHRAQGRIRPGAPAAVGEPFLQVEILDQPFHRARIPLVLRHRSAPTLGVDHGAEPARRPQPLHRPHLQAGFAHLAAVEHRAGFAPQQVVHQLLIRAALHIPRELQRQAAAHLVAKGGAAHAGRCQRSWK